MASFKSALKVDSKEYEITSLSFSISQLIDEKNRGASSVRAHELTIHLIVDDPSNLFKWAADGTKCLDGSIAFAKITEEGTLKELKFVKARCSSYSETFTANKPEPSMVAITIHAEKLTMFDATVDMTVTL